MDKNILVVDDDSLVLKTLTRYLKTFGYDIASAASGQEALQAAEVCSFDLIIADIRMPGMNGIETIKRLRQIIKDKYNTTVPEIIITGYASDENRIEAQQLGVADYIYKPFDVEVFISAVKKNLGK
ncbi:MAG: response regulator [Candidatus Omnitrophota bacterium]|jgi:CheY-like chemotaxis protein